MASEILDLFGEPVPPERGTGRPPHVWTRENSNKVNLLFACGRSVKEVAETIGISQPTLRKVYFSECAKRAAAALKMKAHQLARLNREAEGGNVAAEKALAAMIQAEQVRAVSDRMADRQAKPEPKTRPLGKKEEQHQAAHGVEGKFAPPPPPPLLN